MSKIIGIDLGTSKTMAYEYDEKTNQYTSLTQDENNGIPSIFAYSSVYGNCELVGSKAINCCSLEPENVVTSIKTKLLTPTIQVNHKTYETKYILNKLVSEQLNEIKAKYQLNHFFDDELKKAIVTIPVSFGTEERSILKEAYENNQIEVCAMISEPSAAALVLNEKDIIVVDIGAGTLDMTALTLENGDYKILDVLGNKLAGDQFDEIFMDYLMNIGKLSNIDSEEDKKIARFVVKEIKEKLSFHETWTSKISFKYQSEALLSATRFDLEKALKGEFEKIAQIINDFMMKNKKTNTHLLVTGRSCMIPSLQKTIKSCLDKNVQVHFYDTSVIAKGAAYYASKQVNLKNQMIQYSYYLEIIHNGQLTLQQLIPPKVALPYSKKIDLWTTKEGGVIFSIYEVENGREEYLIEAKNKRLIQEYFENKPSCPANTPFTVYVKVDQNGIVSFNYDLLNDFVEKQFSI